MKKKKDKQFKPSREFIKLAIMEYKARGGKITKIETPKIIHETMDDFNFNEYFQS